MIGVDTNVLIRFLVEDDPDQGAAARAFFEERTGDDPAFLSIVVLIEASWVLATRYRIPPREVDHSFQRLLDVDEVVIQAPDVVRRALRDSAASGAGFADSVVAHLAVDAGCDLTVTFDRAAARLPGMRLLAVSGSQ